jgi:hypothetical protein
MSTPAQAPQTTTSISAIRGLLERNLLERAVALSESRWPGSGPLVELAHEWAGLSPAARRQRLAAIGPEDLGRMRAVAHLQPDLARVLDDLEARGIIPPADETTAETGEPLTREEAVVDAVLDLAQEKVTAAAQAIEPGIAPAAGGVVLTARELAGINLSERPVPMPQVEMPVLDLGLPTTAEFLDTESARRAQLAEQAESVIDRIRARVDAAADRFGAERTAPALPVPPVPAEPVRVAPASPAVAPVVTTTDTRASPRLIQLVRDTPVLELEAVGATASSTDLAAAASDLGLPLVELRTDVGAREFYGGLRREGRAVVPEAGRFPVAVNTANLVVVRGRLTTRAIARLREGFCDIPGTQATVRVDPRCRIVVLPTSG